MSASAPSSVQLWAAAKVVGRECASINKDFFQCKKVSGEDPAACEAHGIMSTACTTKIVTSLETEFPEPFSAFKKCLDYNDYRYNDCRQTESALLNCWNKKMGSIPAEE